MAKTIYTYEIVANNTAIVTDLESRELARDELKLVKKQGYQMLRFFNVNTSYNLNKLYVN